MPARGRAHNADALRIDFPFFRASAHHTHSARSVFQHARMPIAMGTETIFQDEAGEAMLIQPQRVIFPLMRGKPGVAAPGADDYGRARSVGRASEVWRERGNVFVFLAERPRRPFGPKRNRFTCDRSSYKEENASGSNERFHKCEAIISTERDPFRHLSG